MYEQSVVLSVFLCILYDSSILIRVYYCPLGVSDKSYCTNQLYYYITIYLYHYISICLYVYIIIYFTSTIGWVQVVVMQVILRPSTLTSSCSNYLLNKKTLIKLVASKSDSSSNGSSNWNRKQEAHHQVANQVLLL